MGNGKVILGVRYSISSRKAYLIFLAFLIVQTKSYKRTRSASCLPQFENNPALYRPCRNAVCILFLENIPVVDLGSKPHPEPGHPFSCRHRSTLFPDLHGSFFTSIDGISALGDPYCIQADGCTYDDLVKFFGDVKAFGETFRFIAGGLLFLTPYRISSASTASMPFFGGDLLFIGPRSTAFEVSIKSIWSAFTWRSWLLVSATLAIFCVLRCLIVFIFGTPETVHQWRSQFFGASDEADAVKDYSKQILLKFWTSKWRFCVKAAIAILMILFKAGFVSYLIESNKVGLKIRVGNLSKERLREFAVVGNSADEYFFRLIADPQGKFCSSTPPWIQCKDMKELFNNLRNTSHPAKYAVSYDQHAQIALRQQGACDQFTIYYASDVRQKYNAVWYFGQGVPQNQQLGINLNISFLADSSRVSETMYASISKGDSSCGEQPFSVDWLVFLFPVSIVVIPFAIIYFLWTVRQSHCSNVCTSTHKHNSDSTEAITML